MKPVSLLQKSKVFSSRRNVNKNIKAKKKHIIQNQNKTHLSQHTVHQSSAIIENQKIRLTVGDAPLAKWITTLKKHVSKTNHANNTFNNIPKECDSPSPKEQFFGKRFIYPFIEFGAPVYHTTNPQNRSKLAERGVPGIFLGIDNCSKGFRIFTNGKILIERNVKFIRDKKITPGSDVDKFPESGEIDETICASPEPRRSERLKTKHANTASATQTIFEPKTFKQAISCLDKDKWLLAMESELKTIRENNTWSVVDVPKDRNIIGCRWVYKIKKNAM